MSESAKKRPVTVFFHGMNTFGDDRLHIGPLAFGFMHEKWENKFKARGLEFVPALDIGAGPFEEQADVTFNNLHKIGLIDDANVEFHFLCHSAGGIVARVLATHPRLKSRVKTILTMGTPHHGTKASLIGSGFAKKFPRLHAIAKRLNYDTEVKSKSFLHFTPDAMREFNKKYPLHSEARELALFCVVDRLEISAPLIPLYLPLHPKLEPSDGFILQNSQSWGHERHGPFGVDHFGILGDFLALSPRARQKAKREFDRLAEFVFDIISK